MTEWVYYRGGPRDGEVLVGSWVPGGLIVFDAAPPSAYYRLTNATYTDAHRGSVPVADYLGENPPSDEQLPRMQYDATGDGGS